MIRFLEMEVIIYPSSSSSPISMGNDASFIYANPLTRVQITLLGNPLILLKERSNIMEEVVDWSELPPELVGVVAKKITIYADYVRFRAACKKWKLSLSSTLDHLLPQFPWVMMLHSSEISPMLITFDFFNLLENKVHHLNLSDSWSYICHGSSLGCLILQQGRSNIITLMNPLTRVQITLPPFTFYKSMKKVVLSSNPMSHDVAAAIISSRGELGFYKKGNESWTFIKGEAQSYSEDVIYYKNSFYAVNAEGSLAIYDVIGGVLSLVSTIEPPLTESVYLSDNDDFLLYLVYSFEELLLVFKFHRWLDYRDLQHRNNKPTFDVYRLNLSEKIWEPVSSLDDRMLFVGRGYSSPSLLATDFSGCEGNCIYFIDDEARTSENGNQYHYMGVYDLTNGSIKWIPIFSTMSCSDPVPIWFTPNPCKLESSKSI